MRIVFSMDIETSKSVEDVREEIRDLFHKTADYQRNNIIVSELINDLREDIGTEVMVFSSDCEDIGHTRMCLYHFLNWLRDRTP